MKTYAQKRKRKPFDWNVFLKNAIAGKITEAEEKKAEVLAGDWVTCACGNQCSVLGRGDEGEPKDDILYVLGLDFYDHIEGQEYKLAKATLAKIEKRSAALIDAEIKKHKNDLSDFGYSIVKK